MSKEDRELCESKTCCIVCNHGRADKCILPKNIQIAAKKIVDDSVIKTKENACA